MAYAYDVRLAIRRDKEFDACLNQSVAITKYKTSMLENAVALGASIAVLLSYDRNHSIGYAILHGISSWWYVIYRWAGVYLGW